MDGHVDHMAHVTDSDFPLGWRYSDGSFYERELDGGTEAVYRFVGYVSH